MRPRTYNLYFVRGSNDAKVFRFKDSEGNGVTFDDARLTIWKGSTEVIKAVVGDGIEITDAPNGEITYTPRRDNTGQIETRLIPIGTKCIYELELWNGNQETVWLMGSVEGIGGINDDQTA